MEALRSRLTTGEQSGGHQQPQPESPRPKSPSRDSQPNPAPSPQQEQQQQQPHGTSQNHKQPRRQHSGRKRARQPRQSVDSETAAGGKHVEATPPRISRAPSSSSAAAGAASPGPTSSPAPGPSAPATAEDTQEGTPKQKRERKPQRPGKYVCSYCGRACAKPSVLQKHIRSHTGERPYPCAPCGFSFKTKSNLYKHRKSHTHRVKAGLASAKPGVLEEPVTESEDESRQPSSASSLERRASASSHRSQDTERTTEPARGTDDSYAVKKRLAMRLSRGKRGPLGSSDEKSSSLILASRGSTESGYFSRSESTEQQSQDSPPNTSAKSYAEIIMGKYGRLGHLQHPAAQQFSGQEEKSIPFTVPKKQVIDHITKLITINEAVVDTSKIDSVKPRRFSLTRRSSSESPKGALKEPVGNSPIAGEPGFQSSGSITMGVPCDKFHHQSLRLNVSAGQTSAAPLLRSHSMPSAASSADASSASRRSFRLSQSFDERPPSETPMSRRYGMLRRQPAIELPLGELPKEEHQSSLPLYHHHMSTVPDHKQCQPQPYECESCGAGCKDWEGYKTHKQSPCLTQRTLESEIAICQGDRPHLTHPPIRPGALTMRKRRKEESFESDDPSSPVAPSLPAVSSPVHDREESSAAQRESASRATWLPAEKDGGGSSVKVCSVIQHTSSFERQETLCADSQGAEEPHLRIPSDEGPQKQPQQETSQPIPRRLVRQHNVQVPEILVTEDSNTIIESVLSSEPTSVPKQVERTEEFQWPQRSSSLAQLPIEKLPPKKKRLRLAEAAQSSGESSFESISLPRSPSQDSSASHASSRSASFEESNRPDMETATSTTPLRRSRAPHTLMVPGVHPQREMRRSASEQAPHHPQQSVLASEVRSKSFDYSCLSPERSAAGWRERRKCLLMRHTAVRDPEEEEPPAKHGPLKKNPSHSSPSLDPASPSASARASPGSLRLSRSPASPLSADVAACSSTRNICPEPHSQWKLSPSTQLTRTSEVPCPQSPTHKPVSVAPVISSGQCPSISLHPFQSTQGPTGAARAHYLPMSTGLKLEIPPHDRREVEPPQIPPPQPNITHSLEMLRPPVSPAVAVRAHADTLSPACAIYTTLSQTLPARAQETGFSISSNRTLPTTDFTTITTAPGSQTWSEESFRAPGSGGNKRMLSPSSSIEISPESQQQQKRVKEEGQEEERSSQEVGETSGREEKKESQQYLTVVGSPASQGGPSYPSLQSGTSFSWCYLNYTKPNPSAMDEQQPSVYSTWSTSEYDPNPPGLSSKRALSLLQCKQSFSPSIYTMSPMSSSTMEALEPAESRRPCPTEVHASPAGTSDQAETEAEDQQSAEDRGPHGEGEEEKEEEEKQEEEAQSSNQGRETPRRIWVCEGGYRSNEEYVYVRGRGRGKYVCQECGIRCKKPSMLHKHIRLHTDARPYVCKHCSFAFKTKGNLTKHMKSKAHGKKCHAGPVAGCSLDDAKTDEDCPGWPETQKEHQYSDPEGTEDEEDEDDDNEDDDEEEEDEEEDEESWSHYDPPGTSMGPVKLTGPPDPTREAESSQPPKPTPGKPEGGQRTSPPSTRGALFSQQHVRPAVGTVATGFQASPLGSPPPPHRLSPPQTLLPRADPSPSLRHATSPSSPPPPSCHASPSPARQPPPVRAPSPIRAQSPSGGPPGSPASCLAGPSGGPSHTPSLWDTPAATPAKDRAGSVTSKTRLQRTQSVQEASAPQLSPRPGQPQSDNRLLSHLPLHSQQPCGPPSLMIPIGGIHMVQPRTSPLYSLLRRPMSAPVPPGPGGTGDRSGRAGLNEEPPGGSSKRQDTPREAGPGTHTSQRDHRVREGGPGSGQSGRFSDRKCVSNVRRDARASPSPREESKAPPPPSARQGGCSSHTETPGDAHTLIMEGSVFPETAQGQKTPPSWQTKF